MKPSEDGQGGNVCAVCDVCFSGGRCERKPDPSRAAALFRFSWDDMKATPEGEHVSDLELLSKQSELLKKQNDTIGELTAVLNANTVKLQRAVCECAEQHAARLDAESELASRRFAHWATHVASALLIGWLIVSLVGAK